MDGIRITGLILCGGKSSRMGSDKSLLKLDGEFFYHLITKKLSLFTAEVYISCREEQKYRYDLPVITDFHEGHGPMTGLVSAIQHFEDKWIMTCPCDVPDISVGLLAKMTSVIHQDTKIITVVDNNEKIDPLLAIYNPVVFHELLSCYKEGNYSLQRFIEAVPDKILIKTTPNDYTNTNTREDLESLG